jgi:uncharacterized protein (DUF2141 family)
MQTVITYVTLLLTGILMHAQNTIELSMSGLENNQGTVKTGLYNAEGDFLKKEFKTVSSKIIKNKVTVVISDLPDGVYAISSYHDEDNNGELNTILGFIPTESFATSNDAPARFGPPEWKDAKFELNNNGLLKMHIKFN